LQGSVIKIINHGYFRQRVVLLQTIQSLSRESYHFNQQTTIANWVLIHFKVFRPPWFNHWNMQDEWCTCQYRLLWTKWFRPVVLHRQGSSLLRTRA